MNIPLKSKIKLFFKKNIHYKNRIIKINNYYIWLWHILNLPFAFLIGFVWLSICIYDFFEFVHIKIPPEYSLILSFILWLVLNYLYIKMIPINEEKVEETKDIGIR